MKTHKLAVYIGRFQPFHDGHARVIDYALQRAEKVLVLVGSAYRARTVKNPFTYQERKDMINLHVRSAYDSLARIRIDPVMDYPYNFNKWVAEVQSRVSHIQKSNPDSEVLLIGNKDRDNAWYLDSFPQWDFCSVEDVCQTSGTKFRERYFVDSKYRRNFVDGTVEGVPPEVAEYLVQFKQTNDYQYIVDELQFINKYKADWAKAPYPPTFNTVDAVVIQSGHVLVIRRKRSPGKGCYALPGGFVGVDEWLDDAVIRELIEETQIKVPEKVLRGSIQHKQIFDDPNRSSRGRTFSVAYLFRLAHYEPLPKVKGSDDAEAAFWMPISEALKTTDLWFEDHHDILDKMIDLSTI